MSSAYVCLCSVAIPSPDQHACIEVDQDEYNESESTLKHGAGRQASCRQVGLSLHGVGQQHSDHVSQ